MNSNNEGREAEAPRARGPLDPPQHSQRDNSGPSLPVAQQRRSLESWDPCLELASEAEQRRGRCEGEEATEGDTEAVEGPAAKVQGRLNHRADEAHSLQILELDTLRGLTGVYRCLLCRGSRVQGAC